MSRHANEQLQTNDPTKIGNEKSIFGAQSADDTRNRKCNTLINRMLNEERLASQNLAKEKGLAQHYTSLGLAIKISTDYKSRNTA